MRKTTKFLTLLALLLTAATSAWAKEITVTWTASDIKDGFSISKDGVTFTSIPDDQIAMGNLPGGTFTTSLGDFTKIVVTGSTNFINYGSKDQWSNGVWTGQASSVTIGEVDGVSQIVFTIDVPNVDVTSVTLSQTSVSLNVGETETLTATVAPDNATDKSVTWSSSNTAVATVADGVVTAVAAGTATITVTTTDGSKTATCEVTVTEPIHTITLAGNGEGNWLNGEGWNPTTNEMTYEDGIYSITFNDVAAGTYTFKFCLDKSWTDNYGGSATELNTTATAIYNAEDISFTLTETSDVTITFNYSDKTYMIAVPITPKAVTLTIPAQGFATFFCGYPLTTETEDVTLYTVSEVGKETVTLEAIETANAETPFLIYNNGVVAQEVELQPTDEVAAQTFAPEFKGTLVDKTFTDEEMAAADHYVLTATNDFVWVKDAGTIAAGKCWLEVKKSSDLAAPRKSIVFGGETTGVGSVCGVDSATHGTGWFDLSGRRVSQPTKGIYVRAGKKVVK